MDENVVKNIRKTLESKSTDELTSILNEHDTETWSQAAFVAVRRILLDRGELLPEEPSIPEKAASRGLDFRAKQGIVLLLSGLGGIAAGLFHAKFLGVQLATIGSVLGGGLLGALAGMILCLMIPRARTQCVKCGSQNAIRSDKSMATGMVFPNRCQDCGHTWNDGTVSTPSAT